MARSKLKAKKKRDKLLASIDFVMNADNVNGLDFVTGATSTFRNDNEPIIRLTDVNGDRYQASSNEARNPIKGRGTGIPALGIYPTKTNKHSKRSALRLRDLIKQQSYLKNGKPYRY